MITIELPTELENRMHGVLKRTGQTPSMFMQKAVKSYLEKSKTSTTQQKRRLGEAKGMVHIKPDFDNLPDDFMSHFV
jgi:predicted transcriptional regulator